MKILSHLEQQHTSKKSQKVPLTTLSALTTFLGPFKGHRWAEPDEDHLRELMREVYSDPEAAKAVSPGLTSCTLTVT